MARFYYLSGDLTRKSEPNMGANASTENTSQVPPGYVNFQFTYQLPLPLIKRYLENTADALAECMLNSEYGWNLVLKLAFDYSVPSNYVVVDNATCTLESELEALHSTMETFYTTVQPMLLTPLLKIGNVQFLYEMMNALVTSKWAPTFTAELLFFGFRWYVPDTYNSLLQSLPASKSCTSAWVCWCIALTSVRLYYIFMNKDPHALSMWYVLKYQSVFQPLITKVIFSRKRNSELMRNLQYYMEFLCHFLTVLTTANVNDGLLLLVVYLLFSWAAAKIDQMLDKKQELLIALVLALCCVAMASPYLSKIVFSCVTLALRIVSDQIRASCVVREAAEAQLKLICQRFDKK